MKIYTKTGDEGTTALYGGGRVLKDHPRVAAYGTVDELNSVLGMALLQVADDEIRRRLARLQHDLFTLGAVLATVAVEGRPVPKGVPDLPLGRIEEMEAWMDDADGELAPLTAFVLPGGSVGAATLHHARTVCRRAEREVVHLQSREEVDEGVVRYLNRLSDMLFTWARLENHRQGHPDVEWAKE